MDNNSLSLSTYNSQNKPLNMSSTFCLAEQEWIETIPFQAITSLLYGLIFALGTFGNVLVAYVILKNRSMQNPTNIFIANLAFSDVLMCCFSVPFTPIQSFTGKWLFGGILCTLFPVSQVLI
jgi:hypothetical protein